MLSVPARALQSKDELLRRRAMLSLPHIAPLAGYCRRLRAEGRGMVPDFDPLDGGEAAEALFLMEKPGPMTDDAGQDGRTGSGFISRDNNDPTAEAILRFMEDAGIDRQRSVLWNTVPWWNGTRNISAEELLSGTERLEELFDLLPRLKVVIGVGAKSRKARDLIVRKGLPFILSLHPSPINRARRRALWDRIPAQWSSACQYLAIDENKA